MKNKIINLYAINDDLYTEDYVEKFDLIDKVEYIYIDTELFSIGNDLYIIVDNSNSNYEIIQYVDETSFKSLVIDELNNLKNLIENM